MIGFNIVMLCSFLGFVGILAVWSYKILKSANNDSLEQEIMDTLKNHDHRIEKLEKEPKS
jgi:hypothetical protein